MPKVSESLLDNTPNYLKLGALSKRENYSMPNVEDSSMASNSFSNKISGEG